MSWIILVLVAQLLSHTNFCQSGALAWPFFLLLGEGWPAPLLQWRSVAWAIAPARNTILFNYCTHLTFFLVKNVFYVFLSFNLKFNSTYHISIS